MDERYLKLTNTAYELVEFFPESDPLKSRAKEKILAIMEALVLEKNDLAQDIAVLLGYFRVARSQGWVSPMNCFIVMAEYEKIMKLHPFEAVVTNKPAIMPKPVSTAKIGGRKGNIIGFLKENGKGQVMDFQRVLPNVTKRTIRRDLDELLKMGKIERQGEFNQVFYKIRS